MHNHRIQGQRIEQLSIWSVKSNQLVFTLVLQPLHVITSKSDWLTELSLSLVISPSNNKYIALVLVL